MKARSTTKVPAPVSRKKQEKSVKVEDDGYSYTSKRYPGEINTPKSLKKAEKEHVRRKG